MLTPREFPDTRPSLLATMRDDDARQSGWRHFFECYAPAVYRVARMRGLSHPDADDVVQQAMLAISRHIGQFEYDRDRGRFRQWVRRIAESKISNLVRGQRTVRQEAAVLEDVADEAPSLHELWLQEWRLQDMLYCLDQVAIDISPRRMRAFRLYTLEGLPATEVAETLEMTVGYVYATRNQVLNLVRNRMQELEDTP